MINSAYGMLQIFKFLLNVIDGLRHYVARRGGGRRPQDGLRVAGIDHGRGEVGGLRSLHGLLIFCHLILHRLNHDLTNYECMRRARVVPGDCPEQGT